MVLLLMMMMLVQQMQTLHQSNHWQPFRNHAEWR
jgi:hypothetical protein